MVRALVTLVVCCYLLIGSSSLLIAQKQNIDPLLMQELARAESYQFSFKNDSMLLITNKLLNTLAERRQLDTPFGMQVQLVNALGLEQDQRGEWAMKKLLEIKQKSKDRRLWRIHARASLALALLYEKIGRVESSQQELLQAQAIIERYQLDSLYPRFADRRASWERLYGDRDSALYYSREALRVAPQFHLLQEEAVGHMLMTMLLPAASLNERLYHATEAAERYQELGDYTGSSYMFDAISRIHAQRKNSTQALAYSDSAVIAANQAIAEGHERHESIAGMYRYRGEIYRQMGLPDSALANIQKGYEMELAFREKEVNDKIIEIDAQYQNALKQKQIEEQQTTLRNKNYQILFFALIGLLVLLLAIGLFVSNRRQRQARLKLIKQNDLIQRQATRLEELDAAKSRFFANISHELRTPLSLIVGPISTLLRENLVSESQSTLLRAISLSAKQLESMVNDILNLRKLEVDNVPLRNEPTDLRSYFELHLGQFQSLAQSRQVRYNYALNFPPALVTDLDREKCRQIVYNLVSNALKFTPAASSVEVLVEMQGDRLFFQVADSGSGIPETDLPHVFDRFYQASQKGQFSALGTGIGLSICYEYVQLLGGEIGVESKLGQGSTFTVSWPILLTVDQPNVIAPVLVPELEVQDKPALPTKNEVEEVRLKPEPIPAVKPTILVVEDHPGLQEYLRLILSEKHQVISAENGVAAWQMINSEKALPDLILSDLMMPVMDGYHLLEKLKSVDATRHIPVIMLTARADSSTRLRALRIGVDDYLTKPFDEEELLVRIANLLKNQAARRQETLTENEETDSPPLLSETDRAWLEKFETHVRGNLASDTMDIPSLSDTFAMSESTLLRQLKRLTGLSPLQYLREIRLNEARGLLEGSTGLPVSAIATQVGYQDARSFSRSFKKRFGKSPSDFA